MNVSLPAHIKVCPLGELVTFLDHKRRPVREADREPGPYPYLGANGQQGTINSYLFDEPLVLLAEDGGHFEQPERGIAYRVSGKTWVNNHAHVLRPGCDVDWAYLTRVLENHDVRSYVSGSTRAKLTKGQAEKILIPVPPLAEQRRIAAILDQADALRAKRQDTQSLYDMMTRTVFFHIFGNLVRNTLQWPTVEINKVCDLIVDCVNRTAPLSEAPTEYKMIRTSNVRHGRVDLKSVRYVDELTFDRWNRRATPRPDDVILTREAPMGEAGMIETEDKVFLGQRLMLYRTSQRCLMPEYLLYSFSDTFLQEQFNLKGSGSTVKHLPLPACRSFRLRLPPVELQATFSKYVKSIRLLQNCGVQASAQHDALFASLQHRAFRGEL